MLKNSVRTALLCGLSLFTFSAAAYVPPYWMIMSRVAENNGRGIVQVDQDVIFRHAGEPLIIHERWFIENENKMRLEVVGKRQMKDLIRLTYIYTADKKYFIDENGVRKIDRIPMDWLEPYFHFRFSKNIKPMLVAQNVAPVESLKSTPHKYSEKFPLPEKESYVRLSRAGGVVNYAISAAPATNNTDLLPGIWIEQDQFLIRKLRLKSGLTVHANEYKEFAPKLFFPRQREVNHANFKVEIQVQSVKTVPATPKAKELFVPTALDFGKNPSLGRLMPEDAQVLSFYTQTR